MMSNYFPLTGDESPQEESWEDETERFQPPTTPPSENAACVAVESPRGRRGEGG